MKIAAIALSLIVLVAAGLHFRPPSSVARPALVAAPPTSPAAVSTSAGRRPAATPAPSPLVVDVAGAVVHPGLVTLAAGSRVDAAIRHAGGALADANMVAVNRAARLVDGEQVVVPHVGEPVSRQRTVLRERPARPRRADAAPPRPATRALRAAAASVARHRTKKHAPPPDAPVDLNTADVAQLADVPGIGQRLAERIVAFRDDNGLFETVEDLLDVSGISEHKLDAISDFITVRR